MSWIGSHWPETVMVGQQLGRSFEMGKSLLNCWEWVTAGWKDEILFTVFFLPVSAEAVQLPLPCPFKYGGELLVIQSSPDSDHEGTRG